MSVPPPAPKRENLFLNLGCNVAAPALVLSQLTERLGPKPALILAVSFPLAYGIYDLIRRRYCNFLSVLGFSSTLATGGLGLLKLDPFWFAVKEAVVPTLIGLTILVSQWSKKPLVRSLLFNEQVINVPRVDAALDAKGARLAFNRLLSEASWLVAGSFVISAILNFGLARYLIRHMPDTPEFNAELSRMTWLSWPVIVVPSMAIMMVALWRLLRGVEDLTGLSFDDIMHAPEKPAAKTTGAAMGPTGTEGAAAAAQPAGPETNRP